MSEILFGLLPELRFEPTSKRVRAAYYDHPVADTRRAVLLWEPQRVTPVYAIPEADVLVSLGPAQPDPAEALPFALGTGPKLLLDPRTDFRHHTTQGTELTIRIAGSDAESDVPAVKQQRRAGTRSHEPVSVGEGSAAVLEGAAFRPADPSLAGYVALSFAAFTWLEDDEPILAHPRDPFHRIDIRRSSQRRRIELVGVELASTEQPRLLYETMLPVRAYVPRVDVRFDLLVPSPTTTVCPYKGTASYWSVPDVPGGTDIAWSYEEPQPECSTVAGMLCFFEERLDASVDGVLLSRPVTPWS